MRTINNGHPSRRRRPRARAITGAAGLGLATLGLAGFAGAGGHLPLTKPIVGITTDPTTGGYWLTASDGGVFSYGAPFYGSAGNLPLFAPVTGGAAYVNGSGYWSLAADGGVFAYNAPYFGNRITA